MLAFHTRPDPAVTDAVRGLNPKDRHVAALAVNAEADVVVSNDRRLRRQLGRLVSPIAAVAADEFAVQLLNRDRNAMDEVLAAMIAKRQRRPVTRDELIDQLAGAFPRFVAALRRA